MKNTSILKELVMGIGIMKMFSSSFFDKIEGKMENGTDSVFWSAFSGLNEEKKNERPEYKMKVVPGKFCLSRGIYPIKGSNMKERVIELINQIGNSLGSPAYAAKIITECGKELLQIVGNLEEQVEILKQEIETISDLK